MWNPQLLKENLSISNDIRSIKLSNRASGWNAFGNALNWKLFFCILPAFLPLTIVNFTSDYFAVDTHVANWKSSIFNLSQGRATSSIRRSLFLSTYPMAFPRPCTNPKTRKRNMTRKKWWRVIPENKFIHALQLRQKMCFFVSYFVHLLVVLRRPIKQYVCLWFDCNYPQLRQ